MAQSPPRSVAEIDSFITMLQVACEDREINDRLAKLFFRFRTQTAKLSCMPGSRIF